MEQSPPLSTPSCSSLSSTRQRSNIFRRAGPARVRPHPANATSWPRTFSKSLSSRLFNAAITDIQRGQAPFRRRERAQGRPSQIDSRAYKPPSIRHSPHPRASSPPTTSTRRFDFIPIARPPTNNVNAPRRTYLCRLPLRHTTHLSSMATSSPPTLLVRTVVRQRNRSSFASTYVKVAIKPERHVRPSSPMF